MDRLDPAHLFRILNVLSAHIDACYKDAVQPDKTLTGNKFGLDNIVIVIDYDNLRSIFAHFYGKDTDPQGYLSKFLSSVHFTYSLKALKTQYVTSRLSQLTGMSAQVISELFEEDELSSKSIREQVQSFDIALQLNEEPEITLPDKSKLKINTGLLKLFAVMRRLHYSDDRILERMQRLMKQDSRNFYAYVCPYLAFFGMGLAKPNDIPVIWRTEREGSIYQQSFRISPKSGIAVPNDNAWTLLQETKTTDFGPVLRKMLALVSR